MPAPGTTPSSTPHGLQNLNSADSARRARGIEAMTKTSRVSARDPYGLERLARSRAQTPAGIERLFNQVAREWGLGPPTRAEQRAIREETKDPSLKPEQVDQNAYPL